MELFEEEVNAEIAATKQRWDDSEENEETNTEERDRIDLEKDTELIWNGKRIDFRNVRSMKHNKVMYLPEAKTGAKEIRIQN